MPECPVNDCTKGDSIHGHCVCEHCRQSFAEKNLEFMGVGVVYHQPRAIYLCQECIKNGVVSKYGIQN